MYDFLKKQGWGLSATSILIIGIVFFLIRGASDRSGSFEQRILNELIQSDYLAGYSEKLAHLLPDRTNGVSGNVSEQVCAFIFSERYPVQSALLKELDLNMDAFSIALLQAYMELPQKCYPGIEQLNINALKTDVAFLLLKQSKLPENLLSQLISLYESRISEGMWREYCLQLVYFYGDRLLMDSLSGLPDVSRSVEIQIKSVLDVLYGAVAIRDGALAGMALLALYNYEAESERIDKERLGNAAVAVLNDDKFSVSSRLTALDIAEKCGRLNDVLQVSREWLQSSNSTPLQLAAVFKLGGLGTPEDGELLMSFNRRMNFRFSEIINENLAGIAERYSDKIGTSDL